jgi:hypothetical protein
MYPKWMSSNTRQKREREREKEREREREREREDQNGISTALRSAALVQPGSSTSGRHIWKPAALRKGCVNAEKSCCCRQKLCILFQHSFNVQHRPTLV